MKGHPEVIQILNACLTAELTAINQYSIHGKMCANWGYSRLAKHAHDESMEEMRHADALIERILFLQGVPNMQRLNAVRVGETVAEQHELDLAMEIENVKRANEGIELCVKHGDNGSRVLLDSVLKDEEESVDWLESRIEQIEQMGFQNYLAQQVRE